MTDLPTLRILLALVAGMAVSLATPVSDAWLAVLCGIVAQVAFALASSWLLRTRPVLPLAALLRQQVLGLLVLWSIGIGVSAFLVAWPLLELRHNASLAAVLALGLAVSITLLLLWRYWLVWQALERQHDDVRAQWRILAARGFHSWCGLLAASVVLLLCALVIAPAWPSLPDYGLQWPLAWCTALLSPLLHVLLQKLPSTAAPVAISFAAINEDEPALPITESDEFPIHGDSARLYAAARNGQVEQALQLLAEGADVHALPLAQAPDQRSVMVLAAVLPDPRLLRKLLELGADPNQQHGGMSALLAATRDSWYGRPEAVLTLLSNGADPNISDGEGNTPLHHAARSAGAAIATLLCDAGAKLDVCNAEGYSPLALACQLANWPLVQFLLERGASTQPLGGIPALVAAASAEADDSTGIQLLLSHQAKLDACDLHQRSALHLAASAGHVDIVKALLDAGSKIDLRDRAGRTAWLEAAAHGHVKTLKCLLEYSPNIHALDDQGNNAMLLACSAQTVSVSLVQWLLDLGISAKLKSADGRKAVEYAAAAGHWPVVVLLDPKWPLPAAVLDAGQADDLGETLADRPPLLLLSDALTAGNFADTDALVRLCSASELGSLLHLPELALRPQVVDWLLRHGADVHAPNAHGQRLLPTLLDMGSSALPSLQVLLHYGISFTGAGVLARFTSACLHHGGGRADDERFALQLLESGADFSSPSPTGEPLLHLAIRLRWFTLQKRLLAYGADCRIHDSHGLSALHLAAAQGGENTVKQLLLHGAPLDSHSSDGQTPLGMALANGHHQLTHWLQWPHWPLPDRPLEPGDVITAAMAGDSLAVQRLLELGLPTDAVDEQGCTALLRAASGKHYAVVEQLLAYNADPRHANDKGVTPLAAAISAKHSQIVAALLDAGADPQQRLREGGLTALMLASAHGLPDIVEQLLAAGADVHSVDDQQRSALHCAALYGFNAEESDCLLALFDALLRAGADPNQAAAEGLTPLLLLLGGQLKKSAKRCHESVLLVAVERLLTAKVDLQATGGRHGLSALHLAALNGLPKLAKRLLHAGADPQAIDSRGRNPRQIALLRGFVDVAAVFGPVPQSLSLS